MGLCPRLSELQTARPRVAVLHAPLQLASSSCQYRTSTADHQTRPDQGQPVETPQLELEHQEAAEARDRERDAEILEEAGRLAGDRLLAADSRPLLARHLGPSLELVRH